MQIHQSAINNAIGQLGLNDKTWTLHELCDKLADAFDQSPWELPEDAPKDATVRFAPSRPITVELKDGKLEMTLRIAELNHPERNMSFQRFVIRVSYVPWPMACEPHWFAMAWSALTDRAWDLARKCLCEVSSAPSSPSQQRELDTPTMDGRSKSRRIGRISSRSPRRMVIRSCFRRDFAALDSHF